MSNKKKLIPALRFPEFKEDGEWEEKKLGEVLLSTSSNLALNKLVLKLKGKPVYGADGIVGYIDEFQHPEEYISVVKDGSGVGRLNFCIAQSSILGTLTCLKSSNKDRYNLKWIYFLLQTVDFSTFVKGSGIPHIYYADYKNELLPVAYMPEQQKIADCLSSLDDLLAAHNEKLELLKGHKKGLMQNLFPQEGERVPKFRFPEFENDGEWEEKKLGEIAEFSKGKGISKADIIDGGALPCIRYGELYTYYNETISEVKSFTNEGKENLVLSKANDVIIPASGETQIDIATASCVLREGIALGGDLNIIRTQTNGVFLAYYLNNAKKYEIAQMAQGVSVIHLYPTQLQTLTTCFPGKSEQQKIASCLSAVDDLIKAETEKIEALKAHKKGLMQGLFPKMEN